MKVAFFHNLEKGGALNYLVEVSKYLKNNLHTVDLYSFNSNINKVKFDDITIVPLRKTNNILTHMFQSLIEVPIKSTKIYQLIQKGGYDLVIVFPCQLTQAPTILRHLNSTKVIYIATEPKREFYEKTSYDHFSPKRLLARIIRLPIRYLDYSNARKVKNIITISYYEQSLIKKIYDKNSFVIHPALKTIGLEKKKLVNKNLITIGQLSYLKGHHISIKQLRPNQKLTLIGRTTSEEKTIKKLAQKYKANIRIIQTENDFEKNKILKKHNISLVNYINEPYGIATLEALNYGLFVTGLNQGGTSELVRHGVNGFLYPSSCSIAQKSLSKIMSKKAIMYYQNSKINWKETTTKILKIAEYFKKHDYSPPHHQE